MDILEGVLGRFKGKSEVKAPSELGKVPSDIWSYEIFRQYLLALGRRYVDRRTSIPLTQGPISYRNPEFILRTDQYPKEIELSLDWHSILDKIRKDSGDGVERLSVVGTKDNERSLLVQALAAQGLPDYVPAEVIIAQLQKAIEQYHLTTITGDIHSHPRKLLERIWSKVMPINNRGMFSAADLYRIVTPNASMPMIEVVEGNDNVFAFRTKDTINTGLGSELFSQEAFEKYWYERNGFRYLGPVEKFGANRAIPISPRASGWNVNLGIAERHKLVIYRGYSGKNLVREFPAISSAK